MGASGEQGSNFHVIILKIITNLEEPFGHPNSLLCVGAIPWKQASDWLPVSGDDYFILLCILQRRNQSRKLGFGFEYINLEHHFLLG
jgi:hypothetical protein